MPQPFFGPYTKEIEMNFWQLFGPLLVEIVKRIIDRRTGMTFADQDQEMQCDRWATELEEKVQSFKSQGVRGTSEAGLLTDVLELIAALRARDLAKVTALAVRIIFGDVNNPQPQ